MDLADDDSIQPAAPVPRPTTSGPSLDEARGVWNRVKESLEIDQSVCWEDAECSLTLAHQLANYSAEARAFIDNNMMQIVSILLDQRPDLLEQDCVVRSVMLIAVDDLNRNCHLDARNTSLTALARIFDEWYYSPDDDHPSLPEVRHQIVASFQCLCGFKQVAARLDAGVTTPHFPNMGLVEHLLGAAYESAFSTHSAYQTLDAQSIKEDAHAMAKVLMKRLMWLDSTVLDDMSHDAFPAVLLLLQKLHHKLLSESNPHEYLAFLSSWRNLALRMIRSSIMKVKLAGWTQVSNLVVESAKLCPPPRAYLVKGAGTDFVNGRYEFDSTRMNEVGCAKSLDDLQYHRKIPNDADGEGAGKTITLFRCQMRNGQKWWFLSEPDKDQPGTDRDVDYFQHKSRGEDQERLPSRSGWITCYRGEDPAPSLEPAGLLVPPGEENNTPEHQLAKWAIENKLVELALGETTDGEVVESSSELIKFLARMCDKFDWLCEHDCATGINAAPNEFCLRTSDLDTARNTCERTTDIMTLAQMYLLLLRVRPSLSGELRQETYQITQNALLRRVELSDPTLLELKIGVNYIPDPNNGQAGIYNTNDGADIAKLGRCIGTNTNLEGLRFDGTLDFEGMDAALTDEILQGLKQNTSVQSLSMIDCTFSEIARTDALILSAFKERTSSLTELDLSGCAIENGGLPFLVSALRHCTSLNTIRLPENDIGNDDLDDIVGAIRGHGDLKTLSLVGNRIERVDTLADLLKDPKCNLDTLELDHNQVDTTGALLLVAALQHNSKMMSLGLGSNDRVAWEDCVFDALTQLVCNSSSVNATYLSNHSLIDVGVPESHETFYLHRYLEMNAHSDKSQIALEKILLNHPSIDMESMFEWDLKMLYHAVNWFEKAESLPGGDKAEIQRRKLSSIYQFTRAMPLLFAPAWHGRTRRGRKRRLP